ncbi:NAD(P)H-dependent flavin oxidoreductase [Marinisporobacter balticus]|uniref:Probable nitronate monooxygenase n=1 Tax=Marinisporobacter balticus TaxID=2018667 RepID=A0A4R2KGH2_9FIRM|nr:nitronate monooxygenase family protein [Marinisporobacter balticus]TCO71387.1 NAD(P)H-dependent flavin oxidoreductase YrpB (nitropropane dioxygenase family) [Marinisporobacter balticus]
MNIPELKIGDLIAKVPIVQGGMGVGISLSRLAAAVANCGAIGVISGVEPGFNLENYCKDKFQANMDGLAYHIQKAKELAPNGIIGVNIMTALTNFEDMVKVAVKEKVDIIFAGAGMPMKLPSLVKDSFTKIAPIVSSGKVAKLICKQWDRKHDYLPDAIVVEGPEAGGHLGFSIEQLTDTENFSLANIVKEVLEAIKPFEEKYNRKIPIIAGGGLYDGKDIGEILSAGASGVQMATRFVATHECDASDAFKQTYIDAQEEDIMIIKSPVGMPGRAIRNAFVERVYKYGKPKGIKCVNCLKPCNPKETLYCIADALIQAQRGNLEKGFAFAGSKVHKIHEIKSVKEVITELIDGLKKY